MLKTINKWLSERTKIDKIVIKIMVFVFLFFLISANINCLGTKSISEKTNTTKEKDKTEITNDVNETKEINKAIDDEIGTKIVDSGNPLLDKKIDEILSKVNTTKTSGDNSQGFQKHIKRF